MNVESCMLIQVLSNEWIFEKRKEKYRIKINENVMCLVETKTKIYSEFLTFSAQYFFNILINITTKFFE